MDKRTRDYIEDVYEQKKELFDLAFKINDSFGFAVIIDDTSDNKEDYESLLEYLKNYPNATHKEVVYYTIELDQKRHPERYE